MRLSALFLWLGIFVAKDGLGGGKYISCFRLRIPACLSRCFGIRVLRDCHKV